YAGYMIRPYIGIEAVAYSMGDARIKTDQGGGAILDQTIRLQGYGLVAVGAIPLGPVSLNARAGYAAATIKRDNIINGSSVTGSSEKSRAEPIFGVGAKFTVWRGLFVTADWDRVRGETNFNEKFQVDLFSGGIGWKF